MKSILCFSLTTCLVAFVTAAPSVSRWSEPHNMQYIESILEPGALKTLNQLKKDHLHQSSDVSGFLECETCKLVVDLLQTLLEKNSTEEDIASALRVFCVDLKLFSKNVCALAVEEWKDEVLSVAAQVGLSPREACSIVVGDSCEIPYDPWLQDWNITVPDDKPPVSPIPDPKPGSPVTRVLHLSDLHWDQLYTPGLTNDCGEPLCCRPPNNPGNSSTAAGYWGDYKCDVPHQTLVNLMEHLAVTKDQFEWVYLTGDLPAHNVWNQTRDDQLYVLRTLVAMIKKYLPDKIIYPSLGNHESAPVDSFPPPFITGSQSNQWLLNAAAELWGAWLTEEAQETIKRGGFYNIKVRDGLRVISLQTNYANGNNWWLLINNTDPAGQLQWLVDQLMEAEKKGDKVHIIGHIYPSGFTKAFGWNYHRIVNRFESTITAQFFGHTHEDSFQIFFDDQDRKRATNIAYMGPGVTTYQNLNMGYRIYTIDGAYNGSTSMVLDHKVFFLNVSDANISNKPKWQLEYTAKEAFNMTRLCPADWADLVDRFETDDDLFQTFYKFKSKMADRGMCDSSCKANVICDLRTTRTDDPGACKKSLPDGMTMMDVYKYRLRNKMC